MLELGHALGIRLILHPSEAGNRWVEECKTHFRNACGITSVADVSGMQRPYDIVVCGKKVQCKFRSKNRSNVVKIRNSHRATGGWYSDGEVDFFAIAYGKRHFVVPYSALTRHDGTFVNDIHVSRLWKFQDAWDIRGTSVPKVRGWLFNDDLEDAKDGI